MQGLYAAHRQNPLSTNTNSQNPFQVSLHSDQEGATVIPKTVVEQDKPSSTMSLVDSHAINFDLFCMGRTSLLGGSKKETLSTSALVNERLPSMSCGSRLCLDPSVPTQIDQEDHHDDPTPRTSNVTLESLEEQYSQLQQHLNHYRTHSLPDMRQKSKTKTQRRPVLPRAASADLREALARAGALLDKPKPTAPLSAKKEQSPSPRVEDKSSPSRNSSSPTRRTFFMSPPPEKEKSSAVTMGIARSPWQEEKVSSSSSSEDDEEEKDELDMGCFFFSPLAAQSLPGAPVHQEATAVAVTAATSPIKPIHRTVSNDEEEGAYGTAYNYHHLSDEDSDDSSDASSTSDPFCGGYRDYGEGCYDPDEDSDDDDDEWVSLSMHHREQQQQVLGAFDDYVKHFQEEEQHEGDLSTRCLHSLLNSPHSSPTKSRSSLSSSSSEDDSLLSVLSAKRFSSLQSIKEESQEDLDEDDDQQEPESSQAQLVKEKSEQHLKEQEPSPAGIELSSSLELDEEEQEEFVAPLLVDLSREDFDDVSIPDRILSLLDSLDTSLEVQESQHKQEEQQGVPLAETSYLQDQSFECLEASREEECEKLDSFSLEQDDKAAAAATIRPELHPSLECSRDNLDEHSAPGLLEESYQSESSNEEEPSSFFSFFGGSFLPRRRSQQLVVETPPSTPPRAQKTPSMERQAVVTTETGEEMVLSPQSTAALACLQMLSFGLDDPPPSLAFR